MQLEFKDLEYLCALAQHKTITRAAEALFISQPTLSQYLKHLEQRLGVCLYRIEGRKLRLTREGEVLVEQGRKLLRDREDVLASVSNVNCQGYGSISLAIPVGRGSHIIPALIPTFHRRYPNAEIHLMEGDSRQLIRQVQSGECDLVIINMPSVPVHLEYETVGRERMLLVVGSQTPWADYVTYNRKGQARIGLQRCADAPFVLHGPSQHTGQVERRLLHNAGIRPRVVLETKNLEASYRLAACGYGLTFLSEYHVNRLATGKETCNCVLDDPLSQMEIMIGYRKREALSFLAREFLSLARQVLSRPEGAAHRSDNIALP